MDGDTKDAIAGLMLIVGLMLVVASVWMLKGPLIAGLVGGCALIYGASAIGRSDD